MSGCVKRIFYICPYNNPDLYRVCEYGNYSNTGTCRYRTLSGTCTSDEAVYRADCEEFYEVE